MRSMRPLDPDWPPSAKYWDLVDVFDKKGEDRFPLHHHYDCPINLLLGHRSHLGTSIFSLNQRSRLSNSTLQRTSARDSLSLLHPQLQLWYSLWPRKTAHSTHAFDYRTLNKITVHDYHPLSLMNALFERLHSTKIFFTVGFVGHLQPSQHKAGGQVEDDQWFYYGHFKYVVMSFRLFNVSAIFQYFVNYVFCDMIDWFVTNYLDDILIFFDQAQHSKHLHQVLLRLQEKWLFVKQEKCEFDRNAIKFLGYIISTKTLTMDPHKAIVITEWTIPYEVKGAQQFFGFAHFYRWFIRGL